MRKLVRSLPVVLVLIGGSMGATAAVERRTELVRYGEVQIEVVAEGAGPAVVLLPSLARDWTTMTRSPRGWRRRSFSCFDRSRAGSAAAPGR